MNTLLQLNLAHLTRKLDNFLCFSLYNHRPPKQANEIEMKSEYMRNYMRKKLKGQTWKSNGREA